MEWNDENEEKKERRRNKKNAEWFSDMVSVI